MTLEEAIKHCKEVVEKYDELYRIGRTEWEKITCRECAEEHRQLAGWLKLLKRILDSGDCNTCASFHSQCRYAPRLGEQVRYNCPFYSNEKEGEEE